MKHFVYWDDDYHDCGGVGFKSFDDIEAACKFIEDRLNLKPSRGRFKRLHDYKLIRGEQKEIQVIEKVTKIEVV